MTADLRNITFLGASDSGKTSIVEALAHHFGALSRLGSVAEQNTLCDFTEAEQAKKHSLSAAVVHLDKVGLNLIDTPGYPDFLADAVTSMAAAGCAVLCISANNETIPFHAIRLWQMAGDAGLARAVVVTKVDHDNLDLEAVVSNLREHLGAAVVPFTIPNEVGPGFSSVASSDGSDSPYRSNLLDCTVEADDALMEKYLEEGDISEEDLTAGIPVALSLGTLSPVFFLDALRDVGISEFADFLSQRFPTSERQLSALKLAEVEDGLADQPLVALVWKILTDKHLGQISYLRVLQGTLKSDLVVPNPRGNKTIKLSGLSYLFGKDVNPVSEVGPGNLVAVTRVEELELGDVLTVDGSAKHHDFPLPAPYSALAIRPSSRDDEQKIGPELAKIAKEDPTVSVIRHEITHELIVSGLSDLHMQEVLHRLAKRGVSCDTSIPIVAYQETVTSAAEGHYKHKKQSGGAGQFGECYLRLRPNERGEGFDFQDKIVGGSIPRQFIPAVEKGLNEQLASGIIASSRVVDVIVELYDGKHHDVDSDEVSFKIAGGRALRAAFIKANPILLEPIMQVEISVPAKYFGDVSGDLNTRRGHILGLEAEGNFQVIQARVPLAEMQTYGTPLRSMTHGEGNFKMSFDHYDQVPSHLQEKIVAEMGKREED